jgi:hypothetical protein
MRISPKLNSYCFFLLLVIIVLKLMKVLFGRARACVRDGSGALFYFSIATG